MVEGIVVICLAFIFSCCKTNETTKKVPLGILSVGSSQAMTQLSLPQLEADEMCQPLFSFGQFTFSHSTRNRLSFDLFIYVLPLYLFCEKKRRQLFSIRPPRNFSADVIWFHLKPAEIIITRVVIIFIRINFLGKIFSTEEKMRSFFHLFIFRMKVQLRINVRKQIWPDFIFKRQ